MSLPNSSSKSNPPAKEVTDSGFQSSRFATSTGANSQFHSGPTDNPLTIEDTSDNGMRRQLVQVMLRDVLRRHGLPTQSVECQLLVVDSRSRGPGMVVRLVLRQWDERILRYSVAFQNTLKKEILRFDPTAETWLYGISWQIEESGCPYTDMPEKSFWSKPPVAQAAQNAQPQPQPQPQPQLSELEHIGPTVTQAAALSEAAFPKKSQTAAETAALDTAMNNAAALKDLEQLFFIRDQEMVRSSAATTRHYEKTQPSPL